jgi:glycolate oxidase FAD binding subunit
MNIKQIQNIVTHSRQLRIIGDGVHQAHSASNCILDMSLYAGVIEYRSEELVMTAKAGTTIQTIQQILSDSGQSLPFNIDDDSTIGAAYATGSPELSDAILGVKIIDGQGRFLTFGGQVMKNVAGYDVSRLLVGSKGLLAVICEISFKVLPKAYVGPANNLSTVKNHASTIIRHNIEQGLKNIFDPNNIFI